MNVVGIVLIEEEADFLEFFMQELSKMMFLAFCWCMKLEEAAVRSMNLHENQCGQPKHKINAADWLGRSLGWREEEEGLRSFPKFV